MVFKKNMWGSIALICSLSVYYWFSLENSLSSSEAKSLQSNTSSPEKMKVEPIVTEKTGKLFEDNMEDGKFILPPKLNGKNKEITVSPAFKSIPRHIAEQDADQAIAIIGEDVPPEWITRELNAPNSTLSAFKKQMANLPAYTPEALKEEVFAQYSIYEYQREMLSKNRDLSWQGSEIAGWKIGTKYFKALATLLDNDQYEAMLGFKKNSTTALQMANIPHPYDDKSGPSSEVFVTLPIRRSTHGLIKTEEELFQYVDPSTVMEVTNLYKTGESQQHVNEDAHENGEITEDERFRRNQEIFHQTQEQVKVLLTPEQGRIFGLESLWEEQNAIDQK